MAKSRTTKEGGPPFLGGLFSQKSHYKTTIAEGGRKRSGVGNSAREAERNASQNWNKR
jgi:hypothetical protein